MYVKYLLITLLVFLYSCSQEPPADVVYQESVVDETNLIDKEKMDVNSDDVVKMASRFADFKSVSGLKSRAWSNADVNVTEVKDPVSGKSLVYIVNRGDGEGYNGDKCNKSRVA